MGREPKWQAKSFLLNAAFTAVQIFLSFVRSASLYCEEYVYIHISDCVDIVYGLPLVPNKTASETFLHKSGAVRRVHMIFIIGGAGLAMTG
jgi:hypothetical protein